MRGTWYIQSSWTFGRCQGGGETFEKVYGLPAADAPMPFSQPGIVTIPLGFVTLVMASLLTRRGANVAA